MRHPQREHVRGSEEPSPQIRQITQPEQKKGTAINKVTAGFYPRDAKKAQESSGERGKEGTKKHSYAHSEARTKQAREKIPNREGGTTNEWYP